MKIALFAVNGGYTHTNLAIRCLRRGLAAEGFAVELIEHNLRDRTDAMLDALVAAEADLYGFSCYIWNLPVMLTLAADLKALRPDTVIWAGRPRGVVWNRALCRIAWRRLSGQRGRGGRCVGSCLRPSRWCAAG